MVLHTYKKLQTYSLDRQIIKKTRTNIYQFREFNERVTYFFFGTSRFQVQGIVERGQLWFRRPNEQNIMFKIQKKKCSVYTLSSMQCTNNFMSRKYGYVISDLLYHRFRVKLKRYVIISNRRGKSYSKFSIDFIFDRL